MYVCIYIYIYTYDRRVMERQVQRQQDVGGSERMRLS